MGPTRIRISVRGTLSKRLAMAFEGMTLVRRHGHTELIGEIVDQAQLHGLLARIRDLGLELEQVSVSPAETADEPGRKRRKDARRESPRRTRQEGD